MNHQEALTTYIAAFVSELAKTGVRDVVVSPGSRSTPMAMVMAEHPDLNVHIHVDERSAGFFALGIAKASGMPAALLCTSGTAAANYFPAVVEAKISRVPLVVLTADRPHELRDVGAPQAIDQIHLYGGHVKWFAEMAPPENSDEMIRYARTVCARACAESVKAPAGPVHLNFPFREPLIPKLDENLFESQERPEGFVSIQQGELALPDSVFREMADVLSSFQKGILICGPNDDSRFVSEVVKLAETLDYPILADPLSQLRSGKHGKALVIDGYDSFLRTDAAKEALKPDVVIRFGSMPVSKALTIFLKENKDSRQVVVDGGAGWRDPSLLSSEMVYCSEALFCEKIRSFAEHREPGGEYSALWIAVNEKTKLVLAEAGSAVEMSEGKLFLQLAELLPDESTLFVGNSMPIRDLDTFFHNNGKSIRVMGNRGANGIDGIVSTALGAGLYSQPLYLVLGDLTFFHDLNGLIVSKLHNINIHILLINNNGGGIFSFLPQAGEKKNFELLFGTPLDLDFEHAARLYGAKFIRAETWEDFEGAIKEGYGERGLKVTEIMTNRDKNLAEHRELWNRVSREITLFLKGE
ncbi:2-succinyl-5-enolpyruvyl-6-hydroxy-3-cyclohexene-1-carboxylic-acid synthase [Bacillus infantis]|uniref:2-succinyl-5-enolpyruvyl-6-hydroxy-3- cyclohexene-1-carboxylic-acid synthase n=1 Tax=Bacillus infantis TaxID=324767 RepID=UPI003CE82AC0